MKIFITIVIISLCLNCSQGINKKGRCESDIGQQGYYDPERCAVLTSLFYYGVNDVNSTERDRVNRNIFLNATIISCIQWRLEKNKCNKKSEWSPP